MNRRVTDLWLEWDLLYSGTRGGQKGRAYKMFREWILKRTSLKRLFAYLSPKSTARFSLGEARLRNIWFFAALQRKSCR